jgi:hypothetical protein
MVYGQRRLGISPGEESLTAKAPGAPGEDREKTREKTDRKK